MLFLKQFLKLRDHLPVFDEIKAEGRVGIPALVPEDGTRSNKLVAIPGTPPNLKRPPAGCRFAERCKYAMPSCRYNSYPIIDFDQGRSYRCGHSVEHLREVYQGED